MDPPLRLLEKECWLAGALDVQQQLQRRVEQVQQENGSLKETYDALLERQRAAETRLREEKVREAHLLGNTLKPRQQAAAHTNSRNGRRSRYMNPTPHPHWTVA